jgi:U6 snRNA-associated Sm-like protein LSm5
MVLDDVSEYTFTETGEKIVKQIDSILLNGANIAIVVPGGEPESDETI